MEDQQNTFIKEDYVSYMKSGVIRTWKSKLLRLSEFELSFHDSKATSAKVIIPLAEITGCENFAMKNQPNTFKITTEKGTYFIGTYKSNDRDAWLNAIHKQLAQLRVPLLKNDLQATEAIDIEHLSEENSPGATESPEQFDPELERSAQHATMYEDPSTFDKPRRRSILETVRIVVKKRSDSFLKKNQKNIIEDTTLQPTIVNNSPTQVSQIPETHDADIENE